MPPLNMHATALVLGERGILIAGQSGSGKSTLALTLLRDAPAGTFARLVSDDQVLLDIHGGRLICRTPGGIGGLAEVRGLGPAPLSFEHSAPVDLLVRLVSDTDLERLPEPKTELLAGITVARLDVPSCNAATSSLAVLARLSLPPFSSQTRN